MTQQLSNHGIGASEIAAIAGLNPYASPWDIWLVKTGQKAPFDGNAFTEWGHRLEPAIRQAYADQQKVNVVVPPDSLFHAERPWARATPDGIVVDGAAWLHLVQCKNVGSWVERAWKSAPPDYVQLQEQWELYVTGLSRADVAVLIGGNDFRVYTIHRDQKMVDDLVTIASEFWHRVEHRIPPPIDASDACRDHFTNKLKRADLVELNADVTTDQLIEEWRDLHLRIKRDERRVGVIKNTLLADLASAGADRIKSEHGTAKLQRRGGSAKTETNWKMIAELIGSTRCARDEWQSLLSANTKTTQTPESVSLIAPREWAKEST